MAQKLSRPEIILVILTPIVILLFLFGLFVFDVDFYEKKLDESSIPVTINLLDYFQDKAELNEGIFSDDEVSHLGDVKVLINNVLKFLSILVLVSLFLLLYLRDYKKYLLYSGILTVAVPFSLYLIPFNSLFTFFHQIFFPQGNWIFPAGSSLVNLYTSSFFYSFAFTTVWWAFVTGWGLLILGFIVGKMKKFK